MAYVRRHWVDYPDTSTPIDADALNNIEDGIEESHNIQLLAVTDTAPSECAEGDKYFDTTTNLIYTATGTDEWGETGETPIADILYIVLDEQTSYTYNGTTLVSVGGGSSAGGEVLPVGSEIDYDGTTVPTGWEQVEYPNIITAYRSADYSITQTGAYEAIPFDVNEKAGTKLTLNSSGGVVIGAGVANVKISAKITLVGASLTAGNKNLVIMKNGTIVDRIWARIDTYNSYMAMPSRVISVNEGDVITLAFYGTQNDKISGTSPFSQMTVEVVE